MSDKIAREKLTLTKKQARRTIYDDSEEFEKVFEEITDTSRWSVHYYVVIKRLSDGKLFADSYSVGATESPWDYNDPNFREVFAVEKTVIVYE